jgi:glycosyltransferase involved in cell wall biosynthesis
MGVEILREPAAVQDGIKIPKTTMRLAIVQYAGDYREAEQRIRLSGAETYYAQKYSVDAVAALSSRCASVSVICGLTAQPYNEVLENGVRAIGAGFTSTVHEDRIVELVAQEKPDHLIIRTPMRGLFKWAKANNARAIGVFADSFAGKGLKDRIKGHLWAQSLNHKSVDWVFNHGLNSCLSLQQIGVDPGKVIPWDWPAMVEPDPEPRTLSHEKTHSLLYVGLVTEAKGILDVLNAVAQLTSEGSSVQLKVIGGGEIDHFKQVSKSLKIDHRVEFLGLLPHERVQKYMRAVDLIVVPSRHEYAEGLPMTIYESLCSRTPLVASDHPMFRQNLTHEVESLIFPAGDSKALAGNIHRVLNDTQLYERLSRASADSWKRLQLPVKWEEAIVRWLFDPPARESWLYRHRLSSGIYPQRAFIS